MKKRETRVHTRQTERRREIQDVPDSLKLRTILTDLDPLSLNTSVSLGVCKLGFLRVRGHLVLHGVRDVVRGRTELPLTLLPEVWHVCWRGKEIRGTGRRDNRGVKTTRMCFVQVWIQIPLNHAPLLSSHYECDRHSGMYKVLSRFHSSQSSSLRGIRFFVNMSTYVSTESWDGSTNRTGRQSEIMVYFFTKELD